jgi:hypothetical protein
MFVIACLLPCWLRAHDSRYARHCLAVGLLAAANRQLVSPGESLAKTLRGLTAPARTEFRSACLTVSHPVIREAAKSVSSLPGKAVYIWPQENIVGLLAGKAALGYTVQSYAAHTGDLERATIDRLRMAGRPPVVVFKASWAVDGIENLSRTPEIFQFLLREYELHGPPAVNFAVLRKAREGSRPWQEKRLAVDPRNILAQRPNPCVVRFRKGECRANDLLLIRMRSAKTRMFGLAKPGYLATTFWLSNGERRVDKLLLPPDGRTHQVLTCCYRIDEPLFLSVFSPTRWWRAKEYVEVIELQWRPLDLLSREPTDITLEDVSVLVPEGTETLEASLDQQTQPSLADWAYRQGPAPVRGKRPEE